MGNIRLACNVSVVDREIKCRMQRTHTAKYGSKYSTYSLVLLFYHITFRGGQHVRILAFQCSGA